MNFRELLLAEGQLIEPGCPGLAKVGQYRRVDVKNQSDSAFLQSTGDIADQVASRCPSRMDGFPGLDGSRAVWMGMVQSEDDVSRPYILYKTGKFVNVKGVDGICVWLLYAISRLRKICPMKHRPIARFDKPIGACPISARTIQPALFKIKEPVAIS